MKTTSFIILAAGLAGVALAQFSNATFLATVPGDVVIAILAASALMAFAIRDYARDIKPLGLKPALARPIVRVNVVRTTVPAAAPQSKAYGVCRQSALVERSAA